MTTTERNPVATTSASTPSSNRRREFHPLRVSAVDRLCEDAVAVTFDVPEDVADLFDFRPGQSLTVRRRLGDGEHRRSYSICAARGSSLRIGVRLVPDGLFSSWLVDEVAPGEQGLEFVRYGRSYFIP